MIKREMLIFFITLTVFVVPALVFAQMRTLFDVFGLFLDVFNVAVVVVIAFALVFFIWGVVKYIGAQGDEAGKTAARGIMVYGIVALFVMVSVWGLVNILVQTFGTTDTTIPVEVDFVSS